MGTPEGNVVMSFSFDSYQLEEDELQRGSQAKGVLTFMEPASEDPEPQDRYHGIYFAMLLAGVGFLLPYNSFITDVDYLHHKYPGRAPAAAALPAPQTWVEPHCLPLCRDLHSL